VLLIECTLIVMEAFLRLVPGPDFKSGGGCGDTSPAGSIPVRFRHFQNPAWV
jgi:hypothetical protein